MSDALLVQLHAVSLFQTLNETGLRALAGRVKERRLGAGRLVFKEGEPADSMYVVLSGGVKIFLKDAAGKALDDPGLQAEGKVDKAVGQAQRKLGEAKDKARDALKQ